MNRDAKRFCWSRPSNRLVAQPSRNRRPKPSWNQFLCDPVEDSVKLWLTGRNDPVVAHAGKWQIDDGLDAVCRQRSHICKPLPILKSQIKRIRVLNRVIAVGHRTELETDDLADSDGSNLEIVTGILRIGSSQVLLAITHAVVVCIRGRQAVTGIILQKPV